MDIDAAVVRRNHGFIIKLITRPPQEWDKHILEAMSLLELRLAADCRDAQAEIYDLSVIARALHSTPRYQQCRTQ